MLFFLSIASSFARKVTLYFDYVINTTFDFALVWNSKLSDVVSEWVCVSIQTGGGDYTYWFTCFIHSQRFCWDTQLNCCQNPTNLTLLITQTSGRKYTWSKMLSSFLLLITNEIFGCIWFTSHLPLFDVQFRSFPRIFKMSFCLLQMLGEVSPSATPSHMSLLSSVFLSGFVCVCTSVCVCGCLLMFVWVFFIFPRGVDMGWGILINYTPCPSLALMFIFVRALKLTNPSSLCVLSNGSVLAFVRDWKNTNPRRKFLQGNKQWFSHQRMWLTWKRKL